MPIVIIIVFYFFIGLSLVLWDFRKVLFNKDKQTTISSTYLEPPKFLSNLTISTAVVFVVIWPIKLFSKN